MPKSAIRKALISLAKACACLLLVAGSPAIQAKVKAKATTDTDRPVAGLRVLSGSSVSANWYGSGSVRLDAPLCVSSSTGNFRLAVTPSAGLKTLAAGGDVQIGFAERSGKTTLQPVSGLATIFFTGTIDPANSGCDDGPNAKLLIDLPERALSAASAGNYFDQLQLEIEAL